MRKFVLSCIVAFCFIPAFSQHPLAFREDFNDNSNAWNVSDSKDLRTSIANGKYVFEVFNNWSYWQSHGTGLSAANKFELEASFVKALGGGKEGSMGIMLTDIALDRYMFLVNPAKGQFVITKNINSNNGWEDISPWADNEFVAGEGKNNVLKIKKGIDAVLFYINGKEVFKLQNFKYYANLNGYVYIQAGYDIMKMECDYLDIKYETSINLLPDCIKGFKKVNLGSNVNTQYAELCPLISPDGKALYYTIRDSPENNGGAKDDDVYYCEALSDTTWSMRKNIGSPVNTRGINTLISITPDNNYALLMNRYSEEGEVRGKGVSSTSRSKTGWNPPAPLEIRNFENLDAYNEYCLSADGTTLLMAVETKKSIGQRDIYVSFKNKHGKMAAFINAGAGDMWSEPMNLGPVVNTKGGDFSPFLAADGVTMYFSSNGHKGFGDCDIFVTHRLDDTWKKWSVPQNLGPDINGPGWEAYYVIPASGKYAYMVNTDNSIGETDIVRIQLPQSAKPKPVLLVKGKVLNAKTKEPIEAAIIYRELKTNEEVGSAISNPTTGEYNIVLPYGMNYSFIADKKGFFAVNDNLDATSITEYAEISRDLFLTPIEVGTTVRLNNIFFDFNKATLKEESFPELDRIVGFLKDNQSIEIQVSGHTDNVGSDDYNLKLSDDRSKSVYDYLISKGIEAARLKFKGYGETKPVATNDTEEGKALNRRVEFVVLKK